MKNTLPMSVTHPDLSMELDVSKGWNPNKLVAETNLKFDWVCKTCTHRWSASGRNRAKVKGTGCPVCARQCVHSDGRNSMAVTHPALAAELDIAKGWDAAKIIAGTNKKLDWICKKCAHRWSAVGSPRARAEKAVGCPACANKVVHNDGRNSMAVTHPALAVEVDTSKGWDPIKILAGTKESIDWICKTCSHRWSSPATHRGEKCPACTNRSVHDDGRNSMAVTRHDLAEELDASKGWDPTKLVAGTMTLLDWICKKCEHRWSATGNHRSARIEKVCPACAGQALHSDNRNSMAVTHPDLAGELDTSKGWDPTKLFAGTMTKVNWVCRTCRHRWAATGNARAKGSETGCPACANRCLHFEGQNSMAVTHPLLAAELDTSKGWDPTKIVAGTNRRLHWVCSTCGYRWSATGNDRFFGGCCSKCNITGYSASEHLFNTYIGRSIRELLVLYPLLQVEIEHDSSKVTNPDGRAFQVDAKVFWEHELMLAFFYDGLGYHRSEESRVQDRKRRGALCKAYPKAKVLALRHGIPSLGMPHTNYADVSADRNDSILSGVRRLLENEGLSVPDDVDGILAEAEQTWKLLPKANPWKIIGVVNRERKLIAAQPVLQG